MDLAQKTLNERFIQAIETVKRGSLRSFCAEIGLIPQSYAGIKAGKRNAPLQVVNKLVTDYGVSLAWLILGQGQMLTAESSSDDSLAAYQNAYTDAYIGQKVHNESMRPEVQKEVSIVYGDLKPQARKNAIPIIQQKAAAGTIHGFSDPEYVESLPVILFPGLSSGFAVQIQGDSMHPTVKPGDYVIFDEEPAKKLSDNRVYVVYTYDGLLVKRVLDRRATEGIIICKSDNPEHANLVLRPEDIISIHAVKRRLTADFSGPQDTFQRISSLENGLYDLRSELIERLSRLESKGS